MNEPKVDCSQSIIVSKFSSLFFAMGNFVSNQGYDKETWEKFVISKFVMHTDTLRAHKKSATITDYQKKLDTYKS